MLNTSNSNTIASTLQSTLPRSSICIYRWIDDAIFYEDIEDRYHLVRLAPSASTYLGFPLFEASPADLPPLVVD
jgi:hypothetical protein